MRALKRVVTADIIAALKNGTLQNMPSWQAVKCMEKIDTILFGYIARHEKVVVGQSIKESAVQSQVFFEDLGGKLVELLQGVESSLDIAVFALTYNPVRDILFDMAAKGEVKVRIIVDDGTLHQFGDDAPRLGRESNVSVRTDGPDSLMHNKFAIIDNKTVLSGSMNFTHSGAHRNYENFIITTQPTMVLGFVDEFTKIWDEGLPLK